MERGPLDPASQHLRDTAAMLRAWFPHWGWGQCPPFHDHICLSKQKKVVSVVSELLLKIME